MEIVVVQDEDFEASLRVLEKVRLETKEAFHFTATLPALLKNLEALAERWEQTPVWHDPPFLDGEVHIRTGHLRDIAALVRWAQSAIIQ